MEDYKISTNIQSQTLTFDAWENKEQTFSWDADRYEIVLLRQGQLVLKERDKK
jgi:hypothetical protein